MISLTSAYEISAHNWPSSFSAEHLNDPRGVPMIVCKASSALFRQNRAERGNSGSSSRNSTTFDGVMWRCFLRYISSALADFNTADHWIPSSDASLAAAELVLVVSRKYFTSSSRVFLSVRSSSRPMRQKFHASPCDSVMSVMPTNDWLACLTWLKKSYGDSAARCIAASSLSIK